MSDVIKVRLKWSLVIEGAKDENRKEVELAVAHLSEQIEAHVMDAVTTKCPALNISIDTEEEEP